MRTAGAIVFCSGLIAAALLAQTNQPSPPPRAASLPMPSLPPGVGPQPAALNTVPGAPAVPPMPGARPMPPQVDEPVVPAPLRDVPLGHARSTSATMISFLDSSAPFVQGFDCLLMVICGFYCLRSTRARRNFALTIVAICCFVSAIILLGFVLFGIFHGRGLLSQSAYVVARILAPFELLLFAIGIALVARQNVARR
jgi:hypothetical protein